MSQPAPRYPALSALASLAAVSLLVLAGAQPVLAASPPPAPGDRVRPSPMSAMPPPAGYRAPSPAPAPAASTAATVGPNREVFGFVNAGALGSSQVGYSTWNFADLSTVAFFGLHVDSATGHFVQDSEWSEWNNATDIGGLLAAAHTSSHYVKVVLSIILQDFSGSQSVMCAGLGSSNSGVPAATIQQTVAEVAAKHVDGVNVDYEGVDNACGTSDALRSQHLFTSFVGGLRSNLPASSYLSVDTYASSAGDSGGFFNIGQLQASVDSFFVMAYALDNDNYSWSPPGCPRYCLTPTSATTAPYHWNDVSIASQYLAATSAAKIILGIPYFGVKACVAPLSQASPPGPNAVPTGPVSDPSYLIASSDGAQPGVTQYQSGRDALDGLEMMATWKSSTYNCWRQSYWDDTFSLGHKYDLVNQDGLRGVGIFTLDYGGGAPELWDLLGQKFSNTSSLGGQIQGSPAATTWGSGRMDVFAWGADNQLWHQWNTGTGWNRWEPLGGQLSSSPGAVAWAPGRLDVFVRGPDRQLWHKWFTGGSWSGWEALGGVLGSAPAAASWSAGRLDVFVEGADSQLWHRWFDGSAWQAWEPLGGALAGDPGAAAWGPNRLDVVVRGVDGAAYHRWWDGSAWRGYEALGGQLRYGAGLISKASGQLDAFVTGNDGATWRDSWSGGAWSGWQWVGGLWTSAPSAAAPGGGPVDVFARGTDGAAWEVSLSG